MGSDELEASQTFSQTKQNQACYQALHFEAARANSEQTGPADRWTAEASKMLHRAEVGAGVSTPRAERDGERTTNIMPPDEPAARGSKYW